MSQISANVSGFGSVLAVKILASSQLSVQPHQTLFSLSSQSVMDTKQSRILEHRKEWPDSLQLLVKTNYLHQELLTNTQVEKFVDHT